MKEIIKNDLSLSEFLFLLAKSKQFDFKCATVEQSLINKEMLVRTPHSLIVSQKGLNALEAIAADSIGTELLDTRLTLLAKKLKEIFPKGKKEGTNIYWSEGIVLIVRRLKLFIKKYGDAYTDEQILNAAKKYVQGFNGNFTYMQVLKYFIFKEKKGEGGDVEGESQLVTYIENDGEEELEKQDWTSNIR